MFVFWWVEDFFFMCVCMSVCLCVFVLFFSVCNYRCGPGSVSGLVYAGGHVSSPHTSRSLPLVFMARSSEIHSSNSKRGNKIHQFPQVPDTHWSYGRRRRRNGGEEEKKGKQNAHVIGGFMFWNELMTTDSDDCDLTQPDLP